VWGASSSASGGSLLIAGTRPGGTAGLIPGGGVTAGGPPLHQPPGQRATAVWGLVGLGAPRWPEAIRHRRAAASGPRASGSAPRGFRDCRPGGGTVHPVCRSGHVVAVWGRHTASAQAMGGPVGNSPMQPHDGHGFTQQPHDGHGFTRLPTGRRSRHCTARQPAGRGGFRVCHDPGGGPRSLSAPARGRHLQPAALVPH
jgi:hypothetical protein